MRIVKPKLGFFEKLWLKYRNRSAYVDYKAFRMLEEVPDAELRYIDRGDVHFKHSGNAGDIIYAIPTMLALAGTRDIHLHLHIDQFANYDSSINHPLGSVLLNRKMGELLKPLLLSNSQIKTCDIYDSQIVDYDLDAFRKYPLMLDRGNIARWYFLLFAVNYDLIKAWLSVKGDPKYNEAIVIARSHRYRAPGIDYSFIRKYKEVFFIGLLDEFIDMKLMIPHIKHLPVENFLLMAEIIQGSKLFIGNQSFPFAVAEALKVNRMLEVYFKAPNVTPYGDKGYDFCYQPQFEKLVHERYNS